MPDRFPLIVRNQIVVVRGLFFAERRNRGCAGAFSARKFRCDNGYRNAVAHSRIDRLSVNDKNFRIGRFGDCIDDFVRFGQRKGFAARNVD